MTALDATGHTEEARCLNCGVPLRGNAHCGHCGQRAHVHRTIGAFFHDLLHGVLHFEGKVFATLPLALFRPGELTRRYIEGQRARFVSPIALFLLSVFVSFAALSIADIPIADFSDTEQDLKVETQLATEERQLANLQRQVDRLEGRRGDAQQREELEQLYRGRTGGAELSIEQFEPLARKALSDALAEQQGDVDLLQAMSDRGIETASFEKARENGYNEESTREQDLAEKSWLDRQWVLAKRDPQLLAYKIQTAAYKFAWLLIPLSAPLMLILFPLRRRFGLYDHTVFVTYSLSVMLLLMTLSAIGSAMQQPFAVALPVLAMPLHLALHLKGAYSLTWLQWLWRFPLLLAICGAAMLGFAIVLMIIGSA